MKCSKLSNKQQTQHSLNYLHSKHSYIPKQTKTKRKQIKSKLRVGTNLISD